MHYTPRPLSFRWDEDFVAKIDEARGPVKRSPFVREMIERGLAATRGVPDSDLGEPVVHPAAESESGGDPTPASPRAPVFSGRGSPSPSLERFAGRGVAKATKGKQ